MKTLREKLLDELKTYPRGYPTWWVKGRLNDGTTVAQARAELMKMESEGLVTRRESHSNCIVWWTPQAEAVHLQGDAYCRYKWSREYREKSETMSPDSLQYGRCIKASIEHQCEGAKLSAKARKLMGVE